MFVYICSCIYQFVDSQLILVLLRNTLLSLVMLLFLKFISFDINVELH